jgi:hypothetical protein
VPDAPASGPERRLPAGLILPTRLLTTIDAETSFAGDVVRAEVVKRVFLGKTMVVPKGAIVMGRVVGLRREFHPSRQVELRVQFDRLAVGDGAGFALALASVGPSGSVGKNLAHASDGVGPASITVFGNDRLRLKVGTAWSWRTR